MIESRDERYTELIVEVADPDQTVQMVRTALPLAATPIAGSALTVALSHLQQHQSIDRQLHSQRAVDEVYRLRFRQTRFLP